MKRRWGSCAPALLAASAVAAGVVACATGTGKEEVQPRPQLSAERQLQTRRFEGISEEKLLGASVGVLQDLGFTIRVSNAELGLATGVKDREAKAPDQRAAVIVLMILLTAMSGQPPPTGEMKEEQTVRVLLTTRPVPGAAGSHEVRVTFHRFLRQPLVWEADSLRDPKLYEGFFELLSKAVFLEAHRL
ncbi:MAG TPA: hypothetical protein VLC73_06425 [Burkholderiales bacterium]|nr:hypothetical protein [Burkholderiales bacterium]